MNMSRLWRESVFFLFLSVFGFSGCDKDIQMVSLGIDDIYYLPRMKAYALHPAFTGEERLYISCQGYRNIRSYF